MRIIEMKKARLSYESGHVLQLGLPAGGIKSILAGENYG